MGFGLGGRTAISHLLDDRLLDLGGVAALEVGVCLLDLLACAGTSRKSHTLQVSEIGLLGGAGVWAGRAHGRQHRRQPSS